MYNRYIPQPDGSYRKNRMQEPQREPDRISVPPPPPQPVCIPEPVSETENCRHCPRKFPERHPNDYRGKPPVENTGALSFLKKLLPKEFDAEDLLVVLLLLLMTGDSREDRNASLLTLMLYLFL